MNEAAKHLLDRMRHRRSCRNYTGGQIAEEDLKAILQAALYAPTGKNKKETWFCVLREKARLLELAECRAFGSAQLKNASAAIVVFGDEGASDTWVEDASLALQNMSLMADSLGLGACWIQVRLRFTAQEIPTESFLAEKLPKTGIPETARPLAILALGTIAEHPAAYEPVDPFASGRVFAEEEQL